MPGGGPYHAHRWREWDIVSETTTFAGAAYGLGQTPVGGGHGLVECLRQMARKPNYAAAQLELAISIATTIVVVIWRCTSTSLQREWRAADCVARETRLANGGTTLPLDTVVGTAAAERPDRC